MKPANRVLWKLAKPVQVDDTDAPVGFVITSAVNVTGSGPETYVFAAGKDGKVLRYRDLPGSLTGALDHDRAFKAFCKAHDCTGERASVNK